ncbi:MAG: hypothetical protein AAGE84_27130 [Cyanobacteria bacterium P01_G01_bin.39]
MSIKDEIQQLNGYNAVEFETLDVELKEESRRSDSRRGIKDYSIESEIYDY